MILHLEDSRLGGRIECVCIVCGWESTLLISAMFSREVLGEE